MDKYIEALQKKWAADEITNAVIQYIPTWLQQFELEDRLAAMKIISQLEYVTHGDLGQFFLETHKKIIEQFNEDEILVLPVTKVIWEDNGWKPYFKDIKSGHIMNLLYLKINNGLFQFHKEIKLPFKLGTKRIYEKAKCIIFLDDFAGTGKTIDNFLQAFESYYNISPETKRILVCYNLMEPALKLLKGKIHKIYSNEHQSQNVFEKIFKTTGEDCSEIRSILEAYERGFQSHESEEFKYLFGYGQVAACIYYEHNVPNNNLAVLWYGSFNAKIDRKWRPLLIRHRSDSDEKRRMYKSYKALYKVKAEIAYQNWRQVDV